MPSSILLPDYERLMGISREITILDSAKSVLHWDMETMMPPRGITLRSLQLAQMSQIIHRMVANPEVGRLLETISKSPDYDSLNALQKRNVELVKRRYDESVCLPEELVVEMARQEAITIDTWKKAKAVKDYQIFKPKLGRLVELKKKAAECLMVAKGSLTPYDALIDTFEPGITSETIARIFDSLRNDLTRIIQRYAPREVDVSILHRRVPIDTQRRISRMIGDFLGYETTTKDAGGRIDETEHPFTNGYYDDVRITTHYYEENFASSIFSVLHESGHAIYEQNLNQEWKYQPIGSTCSLGFHESQSRFVENILGRSTEFWAYFLPRLREITGNTFDDIDLADLVLAVNRVQPSKIRIEADEVTYCLHIIVRFEIERELIVGKIGVSELPEVWNEKYRNYLGVEIQNDSEGVMQDTHWASGVFGYFPTYALGNIYSGQILAKMEKNVPTWREKITQGNFQPVNSWLVNNVHSYGNLYDPKDLIRRIAGEEITTGPYVGYLDHKFAKLYDVK